jgi:hypothetical protein
MSATISVYHQIFNGLIKLYTGFNYFIVNHIKSTQDTYGADINKRWPENNKLASYWRKAEEVL